MFIVWRLVVATEVAFVMVVVVVCIMTMLSVVVTISAACFAIFGIVASLLIGVLGLVAMDVARFASKLWWRFSLRLVAFVVTIARRFIASIAIAIIAIIATARGMAIVGHVPHLVVVPVFGRTLLSFILFAVLQLELNL